MLIQFNFKNFKSFRDEVSLDLTATRITEHHDHIEKVANEKILKTAVIYGANASGKSNVYEAFKFMSIYVMESFKYGDEIKEENKENISKPLLTPFKFDDTSKNGSSTFEVFYTINNDPHQKTYQYGFTLNNERVLEEWLYYKSKTSKEYFPLFERSDNDTNIHFYKDLKKYEQNIKMSLERECLIVSLGAKLKVEPLKEVRDWFISNEVIDFGNPIENFLYSRMLPNKFVEDEDVRKEVVDYFNCFDKSIKEIDAKKVENIDNKGKNYIKVDSFHKMYDSEEFESIPLEQESSGTLKMFSLFQLLKDVLRKGSILFVDELNARLHPLLVRDIILTFSNKEINTKKAQLIFTTHDVWQLSSNLFRRDEIWFTNKDSNGISTLYSLVDFADDEGTKIRKDENYAKNYLLGNYGAIPELKGFYIFKGM